MVIPMIRVLLNHVRGVQTMEKEMVKCRIEDNHLLSVAIVVDPRFKNRFFPATYQRAMQKKQCKKNEGIRG